MNDREKLIALFTAYYGVDPAYYDVDAPSIADHLLANGVTIQRWIPVEERLPDVGVDVLVVKDNGDKSLAVWRLYRTIPNGKPYWEDEVGDGLVLRAATHWTTLPEPPIEEQNRARGDNG